MLIKLGKQVKLPTNENFTVKYGTINALNPQSIFVSIHSWTTPKYNIRLDKRLSNLTMSVKNKIHEQINYEVFHSKYIVDFDLRASGLSKGKQSFMAIEITLYPKQVIPFPADIYDNSISQLINNLLADIKKDRNFKFANKKTKDYA